MKARFSRAFLAILLAVVFAAGVTNAQQVRLRPIGALQVTGEVRVNEALISTDSTVFAGDRVRTGSDGVAAVSVSGRGTLLLQPGSAVSFPDQAQFLADLEQGRVTLRSLPDTSGFQIRLGNFIAAPVAPAESITEIERAVDGSIRIACRKGSVGLIEVDGARSLFLDANESATILRDGSLQQAEAPASTPSPTPPTPPQAKRKQNWLPWLLVGAGGAGAAAALAGRGSETRPPVSPAQP